MHLRAPAPSTVELVGSPIGPVDADELEFRVTLDPPPSGVPIEIVSMSLTARSCATPMSTARGSIRWCSTSTATGSPVATTAATATTPTHRSGHRRARSATWSSSVSWCSWSPPVDAGGSPQLMLYDMVVIVDASDFSSAECVESNDGDDTQATYLQLPGVDDAVYTLMRAGNGCPTDGTPGSGGGAGGSIWIRTAAGLSVSSDGDRSIFRK